VRKTNPHVSFIILIIFSSLIIAALMVIYLFVPGVGQFINETGQKGVFRRASPTSNAEKLPISSSTSVIQMRATQPAAGPECIPWTEVDSDHTGSYICAYSNYARITVPEENMGEYDPDSEPRSHYTFRMITLNLPGNPLTGYKAAHVYLGNNQVSGYSTQELLGFRCLKFWGTIQSQDNATQTAVRNQGILSINALAPMQIDKVMPCD
jgi:hypothetical protein